MSKLHQSGRREAGIFGSRAYAEAEERKALAEADWWYRRVKQEGLTDSAQDIKKPSAAK